MRNKNTHFLAFLLVLSAIPAARAQVHEVLTPLQVNVEQVQIQTRASDIYYYEQDTLSLPIKDDFSTSKFRKYTAKKTEPGIDSLKHYHLYDMSSNPLPANARFSKSETDRIKVMDTLGTDTSTVYIPLPTQNIKVDTLNKYPIQSLGTKTVYPCYNIVDSTLINPSDVPDTVYLAVCTYYQDSVNVYIVHPRDTTSAIWIDGYVYRNFGFGLRPPTLGVVTFDGLNNVGYPYNFSTTASDYADILTTKPIDLSGLTASDSVFLSFYYQPGGLGDFPESSDSLSVQFLAPGSASIDPIDEEAQWRNVWSTTGPATATPTRFKQVMIHIKDPQFLYSGFKIRFRNHGVISGSIDIWNLDYVFLDRLRFKHDTIGGLNREDVAFQYRANTLLRNKYTSMPLAHFETNPNGFMRDTLTVFKRNNDVGANIVGSRGATVYHDGVLQNNYPLTGSIETAPANSNYTTLYHLDTLNFRYDTTGIDSCATVYDVKFYHNTTPDFCKENDTMYVSQLFSNYYAYDDGTAEFAYGPVGEAGYDVQLAYKFVLAKPDALAGVAIHFSPSVLNEDNKTFYLTVWDNSGPGGAPGNIIYQETTLFDVIYGNTNNRFYVYPFSSLVNVSGTIYVGWKQSDIATMNIGFDRNNVNNDRIYYNVGFGWTNSSFKGSLLMRPVFNSCVTNNVGVHEVASKENSNITLYPNPAHDMVNIGSALPVMQVGVFDLTGQQLMSLGAVTAIPVDGLAKGIYLVNVKTSAGASVHRIVVQ